MEQPASIQRPQHRRLGRALEHLAATGPVAPCAVPSAAVSVFSDETEAIRAFHAEGTARAASLGNRGPLRFGADGHLAADIVDSYYEHGFYIIEGAIQGEELQELTEEFERLIDNAPFGGEQPWKSDVDRHGRAVAQPAAYGFAAPLSDPQGDSPFGVFDFNKGERGEPRHPLKMRQPAPSAGAPAAVVQSIVHPLAYLQGALYAYGHPGLLAVAEALNGPDFTPFTEASFYKPAGFGTSTAWHQDPSSAWDEEWAAGQLPVGHCGTSFHASIYSCNAGNALWVLPGSHLTGRADITAMSEAAGVRPRAIPTTT